MPPLAPVLATLISFVFFFSTATSYSSKKLVRLPKYAAVEAPEQPICFMVGAVAHGAVDVAWADENIAISQYAMSAAGVCAKLTDAFEQTWGVH
jgi:rRNA small subunit pseudouridine methyltransferase Nep1